MINMFLGQTSNNYERAKAKLKNIKQKFDGFCIAFPDVTPNEIMFIQNKWENLPKKIGKGVKIMALSFEEGLRTFITEYSPNGYIKPHRHLDYEFGRVIKGQLTNRLTGKIYREGDEFKLNPNELHYMVSREGSRVYNVLSTNGDYQITNCNKEELLNL